MILLGWVCVAPVSFMPELIEEAVLRFLRTETRPPIH